MNQLEKRAIKFPSKRYGNIVPIKAIPGHFATHHSHINYFVDLTAIKMQHNEAMACARVLAQKYAATMTPIETIVCFDDTSVIGAFLAKELCNSYHVSQKEKYTVNVIHPECNASGQIFFRENVEPMVRGKKVILLMASVSTGITIRHGIECMDYYGGELQGVAAIFGAVDQMDGIRVNAIFHPDDIPGYASYDRKECPYCKRGEPVEALVNSYGYSQF